MSRIKFLLKLETLWLYLAEFCCFENRNNDLVTRLSYGLFQMIKMAISDFVHFHLLMIFNTCLELERSK